MSRAMSFSSDLLPRVPGSLPPWPASITIDLISYFFSPAVLNDANKKIIEIHATNIIFFKIFRLLDLKAITLRKIVNFSVKLKKLLYNLKYAFLLLLIVFFIVEAKGQSLGDDSTSVLQTVPSDTIPDSVSAPSDSIALQQPQGDIKSTIKYSAKDSIVTEVADQLVYLYGDAKIIYGEIELEAEEIKINWENNTLTARGGVDTTGKKIGTPVFKDGPETYVTEEIRYNLESGKAVISGVVTEKNQGYIHGERVKKNAEDELFISEAKYTTCNLEDPHFHISANKLKMIPKDKIVSGPFNLVINDIPTPLGFPFAIFPSPKTRASGIIVPTYGEENQRGFFLRDGGYYFALNDYINLTLLGEIYSKGGKGFKIGSNYRKRYVYNGNVNFHYNQRVTGLPGEEDKSEDFRLQWSHTPQSRGNSRFSASVNAATSSYNNNNSLTFEENINATLNSSVSYSQVFQNTPFNLSMSARHNQNLRTGIVNVTLPEFSLNMNRIYPLNFENVLSSGQSVFEKINLNYSLQGRNIITNSPLRRPGFDIANEGGVNQDTLEFNFDNLDRLFERGEFGFRHRIPVSTSFKALKYLTLSPNFNFDQLFYLKELDYSYDPVKQAVQVDTVKGLSTAYTYSFGAGLSTNIYGTYFFKGEKIQAIRHMITPTLSFSYSPDFSDPKYGYFEEIQIDSTGRSRVLSRYEGFAYGAPSGGESRSMSFGVRNTLEMKVREKQDEDSDSAATYKKIKLLENFSFNSSYNFAAESFKLSPINMSARTTLFDGKLDVSASARLDPYSYIAERDEAGELLRQTRVSSYAWNNGQGIGHLENASIRLNTSFNPEAREKEQAQLDAVEDSPNATPEDIAYIAANPNQYVDWDVPWNLRLSYTWSYTKRGFEESNVTQSLSFSGDISITEKWKIDFTSGYDFQRKEIVDPRLNIYRDLHCWEMRLSWVPTGRFQSYSVNINVKASILQDLKLSRRRSFFDR